MSLSTATDCSLFKASLTSTKTADYYAICSSGDVDITGAEASLPTRYIVVAHNVTIFPAATFWNHSYCILASGTIQYPTELRKVIDNAQIIAVLVSSKMFSDGWLYRYLYNKGFSYPQTAIDLALQTLVLPKDQPEKKE